MRDTFNGTYLFDDQFGCWSGDQDDDNDNYINWLDLCPDSNMTPPDGFTPVTIYEGGCTFDQKDDDGDGIANGNDGCAGTASGAVVDVNGCSRQQQTSTESGGLSTISIIGIIGLIAVVIIAGAIGAVLVIKGRQESEKKPKKSEEKPIVIQDEPAAESFDEDYENDPNYKVDENGCEWWLDDDRNWWYRTPEMDDWAEHGGQD